MANRYRDLLEQLEAIRLKNDHKESKEEDDLLDIMDAVWDKMPQEERNQFN